MDPIIEITGVAHGGDGVGRLEGQVCFVPMALPGDTVRVQIEQTSARFLRASIGEIVTPSPHRVSPPCTNHGRCGACLWGHFAYPAQAEWKRRIVRENLARIAGADIEAGWIENPDLRWGYRTRAEFHGDGEHFGFYAPNSHSVVDTASHPTCHPRLNETLAGLRELRVKGEVTVTVNPEGEDVLIWTSFAQRRLKQKFPQAECGQDRNKHRAYFLFDGAPVVNGTFSQAGLLLNRLLVKTVHNMVGEPVSVLDLYCGNGNLSHSLPAQVEVVGIDHSGFAVQMARKASERDYREGDEEHMLRLLRKGSWDTVVLDPPRAGAKAIMPGLAKSRPHAIVYVSCDPATLARDLKTLASEGWQVTQCTAIDLFPQTPHVETVCRLERP